MVFVVSDPHGHPVQLVAALRTAGLVGDEGDWVGGAQRLFVLGDFFDRGPDGVGVVDLLMRCETQAAAAGGALRAVLGNHEALALGMHAFGPDGTAEDRSRQRTFASSWLRNGGQVTDQERLTAEHLAWLASLPSVVVEDELLLLHSDTLEYLAWGDTVEEINAGVSAALAGDDAAASLMCWQRMTDRYAFTGADGPQLSRLLLDRLGGKHIVHGHTMVPDLTGVCPSEVTGPLVYADGLVTAVDGGLYAGGQLLVVEVRGSRPGS